MNVLFVLSVVGCLIYKYLGKCMEIAWICFILLLYFCPGYWLINEIKYLAPFFMSGILFRKYNYEKIPLWILLSSFFIFTILLSKFNFSMTVYYMQDNIFSYSYFSLFLFRLVIGFTGCLSSILICKMLNKVFYLHKYFVIIGTNTLPIYVLHQKLFEWNKLVGIEITNIIIIFCLTIICIFISLGLYKIFIKNNLVSLLLFGNYIKTRSVE